MRGRKRLAHWPPSQPDMVMMATANKDCYGGWLDAARLSVALRVYVRVTLCIAPDYSQFSKLDERSYMQLRLILSARAFFLEDG